MREHRICIYGTAGSSPAYVRNRLVERALEAAGYRLVYCTVPLWTDTDEKLSAARKGITKTAVRFLLAHIRMALRYLFLVPGHDAVLVLAPGHPDVPFARAVSWIRRKPLVFDAFYSLYDTVVEDRRLAEPGSVKAGVISFLDRLSCRLADAVLIDTEANRDYICTRYRLDSSRFHVIPAGAPEGFDAPFDTSVRPICGTTTVLFQGSYVPLQGAETVVRAAALLRRRPDISFRMIGSGQTRAEAESIAVSEGLGNIVFIDWMSLDGLRQETGRADICLGIFGTGGKAGRVIPHKVFAALAMDRPVITADTPAARELLEDGISALFCPPGKPEALAGCIEKLADDPSLREALAAKAHELDHSVFSTGMVAMRLAGILDDIQGAPAWVDPHLE